MEYSGNISKDLQDEEREKLARIDAKNEFVCPICKLKTPEDAWNYGYEVCNDCFADHQEEISYKHRPERDTNKEGE